MKAPNGKVWGSLGALVLAVVGSVVAIEGGYVSDPNDRGGETNHGITVAVAREHGYTGPMRSMPKGMAQDIYIKTYIVLPGFDRVLAMSPAVGEKLIDFGVNAGPIRAARTFQGALSDLSRGGRDYTPPDIDGIVGPGTLGAYAALERKRGRVKACELVLKLIDGRQAVHYSVLSQNPGQSTFIVGWLDNRIGNVPLSRCNERVAT